MGKPVTDAEFPGLLTGIGASAFRFECQRGYRLDIEQAAFGRFLAGQPQHPSEYDWWQDWLDQVEAQTRAGKTISRVRILDDPRTDYQRWLLSGRRWHAWAGEQIRYLPRSRAQVLGLPLAEDWWLLDGERVIVMRFTPAGEIAGKELITDQEAVASYLTWQHLAVSNATPAGELTAA